MSTVEKVWVNDEYHGWICLEDPALKKIRLLEEEVNKLKLEMTDIQGKIVEAETNGNEGIEDLVAEKASLEERVTQQEQTLEQSRTEHSTPKEAAPEPTIEPEITKGSLVYCSTTQSITEVHSLLPALESEAAVSALLITPPTLTQSPLSSLSLKSSIKVRIHTQDGAFERSYSLELNSSAQLGISEVIAASVKREFGAVTTKVFVGDREVEFRVRQEEVKEEIKEEIKEEVKEEIKEEVKEEIKEEIKEEVKEEIKEEIKEEVKEEIKEEVKEEKVLEVPTVFHPELIYSKTDYIEEESKFVIYADALAGRVTPLFSSSIDVLVIRPMELSCVQLYDRVLYELSQDPGCSFTVNEEIYLFGIGLYGPFPNASGVQAFSFTLNLFNARTKEKATLKAEAIDKDERIYKYFLENPMNVCRGDYIHITKASGQGAVFVLESQQPLFVGLDTVHFRVTNHIKNTIASLYYTKPCDQ